jgi:hypothetical protein
VPRRRGRGDGAGASGEAGDAGASGGGASNRSAGTGGLSDAKLAARTGRSARDWFELLDAEAATRLSHDQIVALLVEVYEAPEWGAQSVAVRYQQERGIPLPGQRPDGTFEVRASRSIRGAQAALLDLAIERGSALAGSAPVAVHRLPERSTASWELSNGDALEARVAAPVRENCAVTLVQSQIRLPELVAGLRRNLDKAVGQVVVDAAEA